MNGPVIETHDLLGFLQGARGLRRVLDGVGLTVREGRSFALLGESGSGKTFLFQSILGLHQGVPGVVAGRARVLGIDVFEGLDSLVRFEDGPSPRIRKDVPGWTRHVRARLASVVGRTVGVVPQDPATSLPPFYTVGRLLETAVRLRRPGLGRREAAAEALGWLDRVQMYGVGDVANRYVHELSGGMVQRVAVALALAPGPRVLVADEPTTGLDPTLRVRVLDLLCEAVDTYGVTLVVITHDTEAARLLAWEVGVLCGGRIVEEGPCGRVLDPSAEPKHPFTRMLLAAERWLSAPGARPEWVEGTPEIPAGGCGFRLRCPSARAECEAGVPELRTVGPGHRLACWGAGS